MQVSKTLCSSELRWMRGAPGTGRARDDGWLSVAGNGWLVFGSAGETRAKNVVLDCACDLVLTC